VKNPLVRNGLTVLVVSIGVLIILFSVSGAWSGVQAMLNPPELDTYDGFVPLEVAVARGEVVKEAPTLVAAITPTPHRTVHWILKSHLGKLAAGGAGPDCD